LKNSGGCAILLLREEIAYEEKSTCNYVSCRVNNVDFGVRKKRKTEIPDLSQYKTDYVGDSSNVINIVSSQEYPEGYSYDSIEIQSETEPYGLTVFLKDEPSAPKLEDELQVNADMTFDLIGNLGTLDYKIADSKEIIASYER
jgi:hypothetical protein